MSRLGAMRGLWIVLGVSLVVACGAPRSQIPSQQGPSPAQAGPKTLTIGLQRGMPAFGGLTGFSTSTSASNITPMVTDAVTYQDETGVHYPLLAVEIPSIEKGTWRLFDDGRMETIWKVRPNVKWHDGTPVTTDDFVFAFGLDKDPDLPRTPTPAIQAKSGISASDPWSMAITWGQLFVDADTSVANPLPRHILDEVYKQDKQAFINSTYWTTEYVSTGPYRIDSWVPGSDMDLVRFDDYYRGRPPFDRVFVKVIGDANALLAAILAGAVDIVLPPGVELDAAIEVKKRWEGTGNEVRADVNGRIIHFEPQFRPEVAKPTLGFRERAVRLGLYQAIDRQALADFMTAGFGPLADSWIRPSDPLRPQLQPFIPLYKHDPAATAPLLESAGWKKGPDGILFDERNAEQFIAEIWANQPAGWDRLASVVASEWKPFGVQAEVVPIPPARIGDREYEAQHKALFVTNVNDEQFYVNRLDSRFKPGPQTRWTGSNRGGYDSPRVDALYEQLRSTIDPRARLPILQTLLQEVMTELAMMPFYWEVLPVLKLGGIKDHRIRTGNSTWNFFDWDRE